MTTCSKCGSTDVLDTKGPWWMGRTLARLFNAGTGVKNRGQLLTRDTSVKSQALTPFRALSSAQTFCNKGFTWGLLYSALTAVDCLSVPLGAAVGGAIGLPVGGVGVIPGTAAGLVVGDAMVDVAAFIAQNYVSQGTILPVAQVQACCAAPKSAANLLNAALVQLQQAAQAIGNLLK